MDACGADVRRRCWGVVASYYRCSVFCLACFSGFGFSRCRDHLLGFSFSCVVFGGVSVPLVVLPPFAARRFIFVCILSTGGVDGVVKPVDQPTIGADSIIVLSTEVRSRCLLEHWKKFLDPSIWPL